jgi:hypothetical protein
MHQHLAFSQSVQHSQDVTVGVLSALGEGVAVVLEVVDEHGKLVVDLFGELRSTQTVQSLIAFPVN